MSDPLKTLDGRQGGIVMSEPKDFIEHVLAQNPILTSPEEQRDVVIEYARECEAENARLREQAEALAAAASIAYEYLGSITVTPNDWRFGMWEELGAALRAYKEANNE